MKAPVDCDHPEWRRIRETPIETGLREVNWTCQDCGDVVGPPSKEHVRYGSPDDDDPSDQTNRVNPWTWR